MTHTTLRGKNLPEAILNLKCLILLTQEVGLSQTTKSEMTFKQRTKHWLTGFLQLNLSYIVNQHSSQELSIN